VPLTTFVGRERELSELRGQLRVARLLTLTGPGGTGKTRLATELAALLTRENEGPVWFAALDGVQEPDLVAPAVVAAAGMHEEAGRPPMETLVQRLRDSDGLLVLDNCEHLLAAAAAIAQTLLLRCPRLRLLATSRAVLDVPGELTWRVPSLHVPARDAAADPEALASVESVRLFTERAAFADPGFRLTRTNAAVVAGICRRLDGIPLAIELAAARARVLSPAQVLERLEDSLSLLTGGSRMTVARQRTLRATIEWSYDLLEPPVRSVFDRLAVFSSGFDLEAAEAVAGGDVLDALASLVDQSLVIAEPGPAGMRYRLLEVLRQFGQARLEERGESDDVRLRHAAYYADFAESVEPEVKGADQARWMATIRQERDNVRAALAWSAGRPAERERIGLRLATALGFFWYADGALAEGRRWLERLGAGDSTSGPSALRAKALADAAWLAFAQAQHSAAASLAERSLALTTDDDPETRVHAWSTLGAVAQDAADYGRAADLFIRALELSRRSGLEWWIASSLDNLGYLAYRSGDLEGSCPLTEEAVALRRVAGDAHGLANSLLNLGAVRFAQGDAREALSLYLESLGLLRQLGATSSITPDVLEELSGVLLALGHPEVAARALSSATAHRAEAGPPALDWRRAAIDRTIAGLRESLGPRAYEAAWAAGSTLSLDLAAAEVLDTRP
jgi:predicted ATPase